jgi:hypothetical protein
MQRSKTMAAGLYRTWRSNPGRRDEFRSLLALGNNTWREQLGADVRTWQAVQGGERTGTITRLMLFPDAAARAVALDRLREATAVVPLQAAMQSASPPATLLGAGMTETIDPVGAPPEAAVLMQRVYRPDPARRQEALDAVRASLRAQDSLPGHAAAWTLPVAGTDSGALLISRGFASHVELNEFTQRNGPVPPLARAVQTGLLMRVSVTVAQRVAA